MERAQGKGHTARETVTPTQLGRTLPLMGLILVVLGLPTNTAAQADPFNFRFNSGQTVGPFFDGWSRNPDGSREMHFGYINRNHVEDVHVPIGAANRIEPGVPDQGQPTFFYPRVHRKVFTVTVPSDWGDKELIWSVTVRDQLQQAIAWLDPVWEIDPILNGRAPTEEQRTNQAPTLAVTPAARTVTLPNTLTLTAIVSDDGLPGARRVVRRARGQETPPTFQPPPGQPTAPVNVPALRTGGHPSVVKLGNGLTITWSVWRGPAIVPVESDSEDAAQDGAVTMTATFTEPGEYVLRARLSDGHLSDRRDITVTVNAAQ